VNYQKTALHIADGSPKMKEMLNEMGGSGLCRTSDAGRSIHP
jgi:hypothetical protein